MVLIIYKPKEIQNIIRSIWLYDTIFFPIMVLGCIILNCQDGGIGRHAGLKILWEEKSRTGSIPVLGTKHNCIIACPKAFTTNYVNSYNNSRQASWIIIIISSHLPSVERGNGAVLVTALECSHRIVVSTQDFHSWNTSSILVGSTK